MNQSPIPSSPNKKPHALSGVLRGLTEPDSAHSEPELRRARMLAWVLLVLIGLDFFSLILAIVDETQRGKYTVLILVLNSALVLALFINRAGHYQSAARLTIFLAVVGPWAPILFDPSILQGNLAAMVYLGLSVVLCGILLTAYATALVAIVQLSGLILLASTHVQSPINWPSLMTYVLFTAALSFVASYLQRKDRDQIDLQTLQLGQEQKQLQAILDNSTSPVYLKDLRGRYLLVNHQYEVLFHVLRTDVIGRTTFDLFPKDTAELYWSSDQKVLKTGLPIEVEEAALAQGETSIFLTHKFPLNDAMGKPYAVCSLSTDITHLKQGEETLREQTVRDPLTGLYNRRYLEETLSREITRASRGKKPLGIIMVDVDHFKYYNDSFGHAAGDLMLRKLGLMLERYVRGSDIACRYGGDEFILIMPDATKAVTSERAELIRNGFKYMRLNDEMAQEEVTLSLGVAIFPENGITAELVFKAADGAMYAAKSGGRDQVCIAE